MKTTFAPPPLSETQKGPKFPVDRLKHAKNVWNKCKNHFSDLASLEVVRMISKITFFSESVYGEVGASNIVC